MQKDNKYQITNTKHPIRKFLGIGDWKLDMRNFCCRQRGFTLLEMIIVIAVLSVLSVMLLAIVNPFVQFQKANDARRKSDLVQVQKALEQYYQDRGSYPSSSNSYLIIDYKTGNPVSWGGQWVPYITFLPKDPTTVRNYVYYSPDQQSYYLYANLERGGQDTQACKYADPTCRADPYNNNGSNACKCASIPSGASCGSGKICNFGISSPNVTP